MTQVEGCGSYVQQDVTVQMSISVRMKTRSQKLVKVMKGTTLQILAGSGLSVSFRANRNHLFVSAKLPPWENLFTTHSCHKRHDATWKYNKYFKELILL